MKTNGSQPELSAWLLHQKPAKNTTKMVFFLTRERGLVRAFCAGGSRKKNYAVLQPFTPLWLTLNERHYGAYVKQVEISSSPYLLMGEGLLAALYLNELLYLALKPEMSDAYLFESYTKALEGLKTAQNRMQIEATLRRFERILIDVSGYHISYTHEAHHDDLIKPEAYYAFLPGEGFVRERTPDTHSILGAHLLAIDADLWDDTAVLKSAKKLMRYAIDNLLDGATIQTRALYQVSNQ